MSANIHNSISDGNAMSKNNVSSIKTVHVLVYTGNTLNRLDIRKFIDVIYKNFEDLVTIPDLGHDHRTISNVMKSPMSITLVAVMDKRIVGYLLANAVKVDDLRQYMHIQYLYTSHRHRGNGIATQLLNTIHRYAKTMNLDRLSLTFDTYDKNLEKFYISNGFNYDNELRSYKRHDMLIKFI
jgi:GNAT superfamily N-acetyltransferase